MIRLVLGEEEVADVRARRLDAVEADHARPARLTKIGTPSRSQMPMKSVLFSIRVTKRCRSAPPRAAA